jgi:hypothetical protein
MAVVFQQRVFAMARGGLLTRLGLVDRIFDTVIWATIGTLPRYIFDKRLGVEELRPSKQERAQVYADASVALRNMYYSKLRKSPITVSESFKCHQEDLAALEKLKEKYSNL